MNRKDRIAVVLTVFCLLWDSWMVSVDAELWGLPSTVLFIYWGYRFIKNDISFLRVKDPKE